MPQVIISSLRGKLHSLTDYAECIVLTASCFVFGHESETAFDSSTTTTGLMQSKTNTTNKALVPFDCKTIFKEPCAGLILLAIYILCDSLTPHLQDVLFIKHRERVHMQSKVGSLQSQKRRT